MKRILYWLAWAVVVAAVVAAFIVCAGLVLHVGPFHPPTAGGYWGGI